MNKDNKNKEVDNADEKLHISDINKCHSKDFKFTLKTKEGKILLQEVVTFGTEEHPFPENWKEDYFAQSSVLDYKQKFIDRNFDIDVSEDTEFDIKKNKIKIMIDVKVLKNSNLDLPKYETENSAGVDIRSNIDIVIPKGDRKLVPTGLHIEIPEGYEAQVRPRSGLALKCGITVLNSPGTIDSDYRGEVGVILMNHGNEDFHINKGDRIAQLVFSTVIQAKFEEVSILNETERGKGGFGSTGKK